MKTPCTLTNECLTGSPHFPVSGGPHLPGFIHCSIITVELPSYV